LVAIHRLDVAGASKEWMKVITIHPEPIKETIAGLVRYAQTDSIYIFNACAAQAC
jgi:hypothetical protein